MDVSTLMHKAEAVLSKKNLKTLKKLMAIAHFEYELRQRQQQMDKYERFVPAKLYNEFKELEQRYNEKIATLN